MSRIHWVYELNIYWVWYQTRHFLWEWISIVLLLWWMHFEIATQPVTWYGTQFFSIVALSMLMMFTKVVLKLNNCVYSVWKSMNLNMIKAILFVHKRNLFHSIHATFTFHPSFCALLHFKFFFSCFLCV